MIDFLNSLSGFIHVNKKNHSLDSGKIIILSENRTMTIKERAIKLIESLPDDCTFEDVLYHLYVCEKVERGMSAIDDGNVISQEEAEKRINDRLRGNSV